MDPSLVPSGPIEVGGGFPPILERPVQVEECLWGDDGRPLFQPGLLAGLGPETRLFVDGDRRHLAAPETTLVESKVACVSSIGAIRTRTDSDSPLGYSRSRSSICPIYHTGGSLGNGVTTRCLAKWETCGVLAARLCPCGHFVLPRNIGGR